MAYQRISATADGVVVKTEVDLVEVTAGELALCANAAAILQLVQVRAGKLFNDLFFHVNRDDSVAVATGVEPKIWPEDAVERPRPGK